MTTPTQPTSIFPVLNAPTAIDYTSKDWLGFVTSMLSYAHSIMPEWDTSSEGDFGVMLVELFAYMGDILSFYGDRLTQEAYLPTATQRLSILNLAQLLGYIPTNGSPSTGTVTLQNTTASPISVPKHTQIASTFSSTADQPIIFETNAVVSVPANGTATIGVTQGISTVQAIIGVSDGTAGQSFQISTPNVEDGTITVFVDSQTGPVQWNPISFLVDADADDLVYSIFVDENQLTNIQFGDNINGEIPGQNLNIFASYTVGVGSAGNLPAGSVGQMVTPITGITVPFVSTGSTVYQSTAMSGGSDPETNDQIRANAPQAYATQSRAVSLNDFSDLALNVPGVLMATATANHSTSVTLYVLGPNYLAPSAGLITNIQNFFTGKTLAGVTLSIGTPALIPVDIGSSGNQVQLQVLPTFSQAVVVQNVTTALQSILSPPNTTFGMLLQVSSIYSAIMQVAGVNYVIIPVMTREDVVQTGTNPIQFRPSEIPTAGTMFITASGGL